VIKIGYGKDYDAFGWADEAEEEEDELLESFGEEARPSDDILDDV
jgi:hypothetical protein